MLTRRGAWNPGARSEEPDFAALTAPARTLPRVLGYFVWLSGPVVLWLVGRRVRLQGQAWWLRAGCIAWLTYALIVVLWLEGLSRLR